MPTHAALADKPQSEKLQFWKKMFWKEIKHIKSGVLRKMLYKYNVHLLIN